MLKLSTAAKQELNRRKAIKEVRFFLHGVAWMKQNYAYQKAIKRNLYNSILW